MGFSHHESCPKCGSDDNLARYEDGGAKCYGHGCDYWEAKGSDSGASAKPRRTSGMALPELGDYQPLPKRGISEATCRKMKYTVGSYTFTQKDTGQRVTKAAHLVHVPDQNGQPAACKVRMAGKEFRYVGETSEAGLVFQDVWPAGCSRKLVITEGEMDALAVSEIQDNKYAVVSLPNGTKSAVEVCGRSREYISSFPEVILMFDQDEPGIEAAREVSRLFNDTVKIAELPAKDASQLLTEGRGREVVNAIFNAKNWSPSGIVRLSDLRDEMRKPLVHGKPWCYPALTQATLGRRPTELYFIGAGAGVGKTDFCLQQITADMEAGEVSAMFLLEQPNVETGRRLVGKHGKKPYHLPPDIGNYTEEEYEASMVELLESGDPYLYNHFGGKDWADIRANIRWLAVSQGVKHFWVDHLTALVSHADDERRELEAICEEMSSDCQDLDINMYVVSHLATPEGKPHEEGGRVMMRHFKGSRAIGFWGHMMFALERNTQAEDPLVRQTTTFRCLKDRYSGRGTGQTFLLGYDAATGMQHEVDERWAERYKELVNPKKDNDYGRDF